ncbi:hypothetical protein [Desulforamulus aquiferis]|uniref:Uncharacterized protein n=1 Tax=Desulforamulus aquiferis TaxID=1397668 RepID=A0AAW7ZEU6_9FIRM|nr:hypothetical protein [Desulforamulus aquiferis]MDO7787871.1 hypothetical protein [Desulforamulus aquiferis]
MSWAAHCQQPLSGRSPGSTACWQSACQVCGSFIWSADTGTCTAGILGRR